MVSFLSVLLVIAMLAVLGVLITGVLVFAKGGETNARLGNRLMNMRVATQAVAVGIFALIILLRSF